MKKLLFITICLLTNLIHADNIFYAIRNNDLNTVTKLLQQQKQTLTLTDYNRYIATSSESVEFLRKQLLLQHKKPKFMANYGLLAVGSFFACLIGSGYAIWNEGPYLAVGLLCASLKGTLSKVVESAMKSIEDHPIETACRVVQAFGALALGAALVADVAWTIVNENRKRALEEAQLAQKLLQLPQ